MRLFDNRGSVNLVEQAEQLGEARATVPIRRPLFPNTATTPAEAIKQMLCSADAVAVMQVKWPQPSLNRQQTWVFTEYLMGIRKIIKDNPAHPLKLGQDIIVARSGGEIKTSDGKRIRVDDQSFPSFFMGQYLLFMRYLPASGHYTTTDPRGAFRVWGPRIGSLLTDKMLFQINHHYNLFNLSQSAATLSCR
jgi:hypothetical protein